MKMEKSEVIGKLITVGIIVAVVYLLIFYLPDTSDRYKGDNVQPIKVAVDLGLSVKWASCNVDAAAPERPGEYFYREDVDATISRWGEGWRLPTADEIKELETKCTWTWFIINDCGGYKITGPNGNSIFLPAAGYIEDDEDGSHREDFNYRGTYWTSAPNYVETQYKMKFYAYNRKGFFADSDDRTIRLVCE